ncbi:MAG: signal peptidase I [Microbacteriaceae bacterium]|nr:signal peptidase I [Microbacteriaceae bacterium]
MAAPKRHRWWFWLIELVLIVFLAKVVSWGVTSFLVQPFVIPSGSMEQTLDVGDRILVNKLTSAVSGYHRGDIVVFRDPGNWLAGEVSNAGDNEYLVKRIIGLPGDRVSCRSPEGPLRVNGVALHETYLADGASPCSDGRLFSRTVPRGSVWVMGDNRQNSADSSAHQSLPGHGAVPESDLVGAVFAVVLPLNRFHFVSNPTAVFAKVPAAG